jgi:hypothetical protein
MQRKGLDFWDVLDDGGLLLLLLLQRRGLRLTTAARGAKREPKEPEFA